jgi:hypothetical protein
MTKPLNCVGKDNTSKVFFYKYNYDMLSGEHSMKIYNSQACNTEFFELTAKEEDDYLKIIMMRKNDEMYGGKGIPDAAIPELATLSEMTVCSSSNGNGNGEYRTEAATKVWERLESKGKAGYDKASDRFTYLP